MSDQTDINQSISDSDALNKIPSGVGIYDVIGNHVEMKYLNDGYYQMLGTRRDERDHYLGIHVMDAIHPDDRLRVLQEAHDAICKGRIFDQRFRVMDGRGVYIWIGIRANHNRLGNDAERFYAAYYNVDQYVSERDELAAYGNHLDELLGNIPGGVGIFSEQCGQVRLIYANAGFYALHHGSREYLSERSENPIDWLTPEDRHLFWDEFNKLASGEKLQGSVTYRIIGEDGQLHWVCNQFCRAYRQDGVQYYYSSFIDMDEQIAAEQELLQDKLMYDDVAKAAKLIIWSYDISTHRATLMQSGYTQEMCRLLHVPHVIESVVEAIIPYVHADDREIFRNAYQSIDEGAESAECEFRLQLPDQDTIQQEWMTLKRITDKSGRLLNVYCYGQNITEQRQKEDNYERLRAQLAGNLKSAVSTTQLNLSKNRYISGYSPFPGVEKSMNRKMADEHFAAAAASVINTELKAEILRDYRCSNLLALFKNGKQQMERTYPIQTSGGEIMWIHTTLQMMQNPHTGDVEGVTYANDITAQKRNEEIIQKLASAGCDYIGILGTAGRVFEMQINNWDCDAVMAGQKMDYDTVRKMLADDYIETDRRKAFLRSTALGTLIAALKEKVLYVVAYDHFAVSSADAPLKKQILFSWMNEEKREILCIQQDVTAAYRKEQEQMLLLEKEKRAAEAANVAKSQFLSRMSHDIRTPLNGIIGMTYLAQEQQNPAQTADFLGKIDTSSKFLLSLINDVLDMAKAESGKIELHPEPYPVDEFADYMSSIIAPLCQERNQTFLFEPAEVLTDVIPLLDKLRINQVVFNLLSNAVKYTPEGGTIRYRVVEKQLDPGRMSMHFEISDNGIGMSEKFQKVLFEPFTQENCGESLEMRGSGLGLAITKRLIDAMGGTVKVASQLGKGTTFTVDFVLDCVRAEREEKAEQRGNGIGESIAGCHVLLCEDHPLNQEIANTILTEQGLLVDVASDGAQGIESFEKSSYGFFDCILMDIRMPVLNGYDAAQAIRSLNRPDAKSVPIFAMTADAFADDVQRCLDVGMNGHIAKPIDPKQLYQTLTDAISAAKSGRLSP